MVSTHLEVFLKDGEMSITTKKLEKYVQKGAFNKNGNPPKLSGHNVAFVIGWFNETLPLLLKEHYDKKNIVCSYGQ